MSSHNPTDPLPDTLTVILDLAVMPLTFDVAYAVANGEVERRRRGYRRLSVLVVPPFDESRRAAAHPYPLDHQRWRVRQIILPVASLAAAGGGVTGGGVVVCRTREEARALVAARAPHLFPPAYDIDHPREIYWFSHLMARAEDGLDVRVLEAPEAARRRARRWLDERAGGRRVVTITLRETAYSDVRNSRLEDWAAFAAGLDPERYLPVVLRDMARAHEPLPGDWGAAVSWPEPVWNVPLRTALYELAWFNLLVNNGPAALAYLNPHAPCAVLKMLADVNEARAQHQRRLGVEPYGQYPFSAPTQRLVWEDDELPAIRRAFDAFVRLAEGEAPPSVEADGAVGFADRMRRSALEWQSAGNLHEAELDLRRLLDDRPEDAAALAHLGAILRLRDRHGHSGSAPDAALEPAMRAALLAPGDGDVRRLAVAIALDAAGRRLDRLAAPDLSGAPDRDLAAAEDAARRARRLVPRWTAPRRRLAAVLEARAGLLRHRDPEREGDEIHRLLTEASALVPDDLAVRAQLAASHAVQACRHAAAGRGAEAWRHALAALRLDPEDPAVQQAVALNLTDPALADPTLADPDGLPALDGEVLHRLAAFADAWFTAPGPDRAAVVPGLAAILRRVLPQGVALDFPSAAAPPGALALAELLLCEARLTAATLEALLPRLLERRAALLRQVPPALSDSDERLLAAVACQAERHAYGWPAAPAERAEAARLAGTLALTGDGMLPVAALVVALYQPLPDAVLRRAGPAPSGWEDGDPRLRLLGRAAGF
ncbi:hypothetical protein [Azospirillum sp. B2RO_4]|uniref:hypothetical protein n=1 Tax=Azospirillum sp. B2RO_4 TaxID=3027796 RepID=UPI003DA85100